MKQQGLIYFTDIHLTVIGLTLFFAVFVGVIWWTSRKENKLLYRRVQNLPLESEQGHEQ